VAPVCLPRPRCPPLFPYTTLFRSLSMLFCVGGFNLGNDPFAFLDPDPVLNVPLIDSYKKYAITFQLCVVAVSRSDSGFRSSVLRSEEHTSELQSRANLVCRLLREK